MLVTPVMPDSQQDISVHAKQYFRVILEGIDPTRETPETFVMKLSIRTRTTFPRAKALVRHLPRTVRKGLSAAGANQLKAVLEDIGGRVRLESYLETPGEESQVASGVERMETSPDGTMVCRGCGNGEAAGAKFCSFCHRRFRDLNARPLSLKERLPEENPLGEDYVVEAVEAAWLSWVKANPKWVAGAAIALLLLILLIK